VNKDNEAGTYRACTGINKEFNEWSMRRCREQGKKILER
jgi:hypothetical protein